MAMANTMGRAMSMFVSADARSPVPPEVVDADGQRHQDARTFQAAGLPVIGVRVYLVGVLVGRYQTVDEAISPMPAKKASNM